MSLVAGLVLLYLVGRRNERAVWRDWELVLTPKGQTVYRTIEERVETELAIMKTAYDNAHHDERLGSIDEARHLLQIGHQVIERFSPSMMRLLAITLAFSADGLGHGAHRAAAGRATSSCASWRASRT
jgi:hypothetical protein